MPVYEYHCQVCSGWTQSFRWMSERHKPLACMHCGAKAHLATRGKLRGEPESKMSGVEELPQVPSEGGLVDGPTGRRYRVLGAACCDESCNGEEVYTHWLDEPEPSPPSCPVCGGECRKVSLTDNATSRFSEVFPYYDLGAGRTFQNKKERRAWMKANNLECYDGDMTPSLERWERAADDEERRVMDKYRENLDRYKHDPETREVYARIQAQGRLPEHRR